MKLQIIETLWFTGDTSKSLPLAIFLKIQNLFVKKVL